MVHDSAAIGSKIALLTLEEKVALLTGFNQFHLLGNEKIGLRQVLLSNGPSGVRGANFDESDLSLSLPSPTSLASAWSRGFAKEYGEILVEEAQRKGVDVILGPTINMQRSPLGGRHFESLSEDPYLSGELAAELTRTLQNSGIGACPKHFVCNDSETERFRVDVQVSERALHEVYLKPFEAVVRDSNAWMVMSSYNKVNGTTMTESELLQDPLREQWGFDGVVVSDWTAVRSLESALAEQDLVMPGPDGPWGQALVEAVRTGRIPEGNIDRKVARILLLASRVGALGDDGNPPPDKIAQGAISEDAKAFARKAAIEGSVLLSNDGILPVDFRVVSKVALIGPSAKNPRTQGGGSAAVASAKPATPFDELQRMLGSGLKYAAGVEINEGLVELPRENIFNPETGAAGLKVEFFNDAQEIIFSEARESSILFWMSSEMPLPQTSRIRVSTVIAPEVDLEIRLGFASARPVALTLDGLELISSQGSPIVGDIIGEFMAPKIQTVDVKILAGERRLLVADIDVRGRHGRMLQVWAFRLGHEVTVADPEGLIREAVQLATQSEIAIVMVGTNAATESEGFDRKNLLLPGKQDELVARVVAANPNTIVVLNAGAPVEMPWRNSVRAILQVNFAGEQMAQAIAEMLSGMSEPGGRLTTSWPASEKDLPVSQVKPDSNFQLEYSEGIHMGYRAWLKSSVQPAFHFGHGMGFTSWNYGEVAVAPRVAAGRDFSVSLDISNLGDRIGKTVIQVYASKASSRVDRPVRWLVGFADIRLSPAQTSRLTINIKSNEFAYFESGWVVEPGEYLLHFGTSVADIFETVSFEMVASEFENSGSIQISKTNPVRLVGVARGN